MPDHVPSVPGGPHLRTVAMPRDTNAGGAIFGGGRCRRWTWLAARAGDTSVAVRIETWTRGRAGGDPQKVTEGVFAYVALDEDGKPRTLGQAS